MFITVISKIANIGISSAVSRILVSKTPIRDRIIFGTCEAIGLAFATMMIGDKVEEYSKEKMNEWKSSFRLEIIKPEEVKDAGPNEEESEIEDADISEEFDKEEQDG